MPLTGLKLYGSTVKNFRSGLGWGTQKGSVTVSLVQDSTLGDYFLPPPVGSLTYVQFEQLNFWGILQKWEQSASSSGLPTYEVYIEDPRSILEGAEVILDNYSASVYGIPNLLNVYGYLENLGGFGASQVNETGMPWSLVAPAIYDITNGLAGLYGGPLSYKGYYYNVDLSGLPSVPAYYRIGGSTSVSLLEIIDRICNDAGCDYFIDIIPGTTTIRVRTASRRLQPPTGYIQALVDSAISSGILVDSKVGVEAVVSQVTSSFLIGGAVQSMYDAQPSSIEPYFGKDVNGNPILSVGTDYLLTANLNSSEVNDILGSFYYPCTALEMCFALADQNDWRNYVAAIRPDVAALIGLTSANVPPDFNGAPVPVMPQDFLNLTPAAILAMAGANADDLSEWKTQRLFNFVRKSASEYLGKKFLVQIPFMFSAVDEDSGKVFTSYEVADGGYVESGVPPLGLHPIYANDFSSSDGLFKSYALYTDTAIADLGRVDKNEFLIDVYNGNGIYVSVSVDSEIIFLDELTPCVSVTISNPLYRPPTDAMGGIDEIIAIYQVTAPEAQDIFKKLGAGNWYPTLNTLPIQPTYITIPFKSNILTYGPWYAIGAQGKVYFQQDSTLVPWKYGGSDLMNLTASSKVSESVTGQQSSESGSVTLVGAPLFNIGDQLTLTGETLLGPTITSIDVGYSDSGVISTYNMRTFTTKFGAFSKDNVERIKKLTLRSQELRRESLDAINRILVPREVTNDIVAAIGAGTREGKPPQFQRNSPHSVFAAIVDSDADDSSLLRVSATTLPDKEIALAIPSSSIDPDLYDKSSLMSVTGLIRPINTNVSSTWLPHYETPNANYSANAISTFLNPFKSGNDIELYTYGSTTPDCHAYLNNGPTTGGVRGFGLRGPLVISGWGWCTDDAFVPNQNPTTLDGSELTDYLRKSQFWKTGPVDLLWDDERMVWTPHGMMIGVTVGICTANGGSTTVKLYDDAGEVTGRKKDRTAYNFFSVDVNAGKRVAAAWIPDAQKWYIIAADC